MSSSALLDNLIEALQVMPGIGPVSATRIAYHLLDRNRNGGTELSKALSDALNNIALCPVCRNYTDHKDTVCALCSQEKRKNSALLCVVESPSDVEAIEKTGTYYGSYFVLHGHLSPIDRIGPAQIGLDELRERLEKEHIEEVILALSQTVDGEVTASYITSIARKLNIEVSKIAQGVPVGGELTSVDGNTLASSLNFRHKI
ncbi:MAG: recombination protein RecR [Succinivibrio sp.]|jgi:recombination protein RecR|nr:recombination protein RecR [Succinivibrio sp.]